MISTIEIQPHIVAHTVARYLKKDFKVYTQKDKVVSVQELHEYIRGLLLANETKEFYDVQAPGNSY